MKKPETMYEASAQFREAIKDLISATRFPALVDRLVTWYMRVFRGKTWDGKGWVNG